MKENKPIESKRSYTLTDIYKQLWEDKKSLSRTEFREIAVTFNHLLARYLIETGEEVRLPNKLGRLRILKRQPDAKKESPIDFTTYLKTGKIKKHNNKHSNGYYAKYDWDYCWPVAMFNFQGMWRFEATRSHKRYLAKMIKEHNYIMKYFDNEN